jgi:hypothetical protein
MFKSLPLVVLCLAPTESFLLPQAGRISLCAHSPRRTPEAQLNLFNDFKRGVAAFSTAKQSFNACACVQ